MMRADTRRIGFQRRWAEARCLLAVLCLVLTYAALPIATADASPPACTIYWTGATSTDWATTSNWSLSDGGSDAGRTPDGSDVACMSSAPQTAAIDVSSSTDTSVDALQMPASADVTPSLTIEGSLTLADDSAVADIDVPGTLTLDNVADTTVQTGSVSGTLAGDGRLEIDGTATLESFTLDGADSSDVVGILLRGDSTMGGTDFLSDGAIENAGAMTIDGSTDTTTTDPNDFADLESTGLVNDANATITYRGTRPSEAARLEVPFWNSGSVTVQGGTFQTSDFGAESSIAVAGSYIIAKGATWHLESVDASDSTPGSRLVASPGSISGAGTMWVDGPSLGLQNGVTWSSTLALELTNNGALALDSGEDITAATLTSQYGTVAGPGSLTVTGTATIPSIALGGYNADSGDTEYEDLTLEGHSTVGGIALLTDGNEIGSGSELENAGTLTLADGGEVIADSDDGLVQNDAHATISYSGLSGVLFEVPLSNAGTVRAAGPLVTASPVTFEDGSTANFAGGELDVEGGGTVESGAVVTGAEFDVGTEPVDVAAGATFAPASLWMFGTLQLAAGEDVTVHNLDLSSGGQLIGPGSLTATGTSTLGSNAELGAPGDVADAAHLTIEASAYIQGRLSLAGNSELENKGTLLMTDFSNLRWAGDPSDELLNDPGSTIRYTASGSSLMATIGAPLTNQGTVSVSKGTLDLQSLSNLSGGTLSGGSYVANGGTLELPDDITTNAASVTVGASPSSIVDQSDDDALGSLSSNIDSLSVRRSELLTGTLANAGTVMLQSGGALRATSYSQSAGTTTVAKGATLTAAGGTAIGGGLLTGGGTVVGNVQNGGTITPDLTLSASGGYADTGGTVEIDVSSAGSGRVAASGTATLGGTLDLSTANGYVPPVGTKLTLVKAASVSGTFASVTGAQLSDRRYALQYLTTAVVATVVSGPPTVTGISPAAGSNAGGDTVTVSGTNFLTGATSVYFGQAQATNVNVTSSGSLTATSPASSGAHPGTGGRVQLHVKTAGGTSATGTASVYTYGAPVITSISPDSGGTAGGNTVTIWGSGFVPGLTVLFGAAPATVTYVAWDELKVTVPAQAAGAIGIRVETNGGESADVRADQYGYGAPVVTGISPNGGTAAGGAPVAINGSGFVPGDTVTFGSTIVTPSYVSSSQLHVTAPAGSPGTVHVRVHSRGGASTTVSGDRFTYS